MFLFGLFALIFPYFNTFSVSKRSQEKELKQVLIDNNLIVNGKIDFTKPIIDSVKYEVESKFEFLTKRSDKEYLKTFLPNKNLSDLIKAHLERSLNKAKVNKPFYQYCFSELTIIRA